MIPYEEKVSATLRVEEEVVDLDNMTCPVARDSWMDIDKGFVLL